MGIRVHKIASRMLLLCALCILSIVVATGSLAVWASGGAGGSQSSKPTVSGCYKNWPLDQRKKHSKWNDTCFGTTWRFHTTNSGSEYDSSYSSADKPTIDQIHKDCEPYGGTYYRLGYEIFKTNFSSDPSKHVATGYQQGFKRVNETANGGGSIKFIQVGSSLAWDDVKAKFDTAQEIFKNDPNASGNLKNLKWEDTSWFCYDVTWDSPTTGFKSKSKVSSGASSSESMDWDRDANDLEVKADENGEAKVTFAHKLKYNSGKLAGSYNMATTTYTITIDDGSGGPWTGVFEAPGAEDKESEWMPSPNITTTIKMSEGETERKVCSTISYTTKTLSWDSSNPHNMQAQNDTGQTKACAIVKRDEVVRTNAGGVLFWPQSSVESVAGQDVFNHKVWTTDDKDRADGDIVSLQLSTDFDQAKANFEHKIHVEVDLNGYTVGENDEWDATNMCTEYWVNYADGTTSSKEKFCAPKPGSGLSTASGKKSVPGKQGFVIDVEGKAIEKINYQPKTIPIKREEKKDGPCDTVPETNTCSWNPARYKYYADANSGSGSGNSSAEIEYVSPNEPDESNGKPSSSGGANGGPMYAGESQKMTWKGHATATNTRRIIEYQSVAFEVMYDKWYSASSVEGDISKTPQLKYPNRIQLDPCTYWGQQHKLGVFRSNLGGCASVSGVSYAYGPEGYAADHTFTGARSMVIPDYVGDKYCNSFGYKWQYYWGVKRKSEGSRWQWSTDPLTYWTHYDAACRTIAKKPSFVTWNGGVFANGGIATSLASRYNDTRVGTIAGTIENPMADFSFGSWTEHLGIANGGILNFGTGGSLAFGSNSIGVSINSNSPLTIRNDIALGSAGITKNPTLVSRLSDYLGGIPETEYHSESEVNIYSSIVSNGGADDIYSLPQKIIYAPNASKVNIYSGATQIDAWIIAPNAVINTCADFTSSNGNPGGTETRPAGSHPCDAPLRVNGPVIASSLKLNRTGGADITNDGDNYTAVLGPTYIDDWQKYTPTEVFNLSADTYLWAYAQAGRYGSSYTEAYSRELPPRY